MDTKTDKEQECIETFTICEDSSEYIPYLDKIKGKNIAVSRVQREQIELLMELRMSCEDSYNVACIVMEMIDNLKDKVPDGKNFINCVLDMILLEYTD